MSLHSFPEHNTDLCTFRSKWLLEASQFSLRSVSDKSVNLIVRIQKVLQPSFKQSRLLYTFFSWSTWEWSKDAPPCYGDASVVFLTVPISLCRSFMCATWGHANDCSRECPTVVGTVDSQQEDLIDRVRHTQHQSGGSAAGHLSHLENTPYWASVHHFFAWPVGQLDLVLAA